MNRSDYDSNMVVQYFDDFGIQEWERLVQSPFYEVSLYIHTYYLKT